MSCCALESFIVFFFFCCCYCLVCVYNILLFVLVYILCMVYLLYYMYVYLYRRFVSFFLFCCGGVFRIEFSRTSNHKLNWTVQKNKQQYYMVLAWTTTPHYSQHNNMNVVWIHTLYESTHIQSSSSDSSSSSSTQSPLIPSLYMRLCVVHVLCTHVVCICINTSAICVFIYLFTVSLYMYVCVCASCVCILLCLSQSLMIRFRQLIFFLPNISYHIHRYRVLILSRSVGWSVACIAVELYMLM